MHNGLFTLPGMNFDTDPGMDIRLKNRYKMIEDPDLDWNLSLSLLQSFDNRLN